VETFLETQCILNFMNEYINGNDNIIQLTSILNLILKVNPMFHSILFVTTGVVYNAAKKRYTRKYLYITLSA